MPHPQNRHQRLKAGQHQLQRQKSMLVSSAFVTRQAHHRAQNVGTPAKAAPPTRLVVRVTMVVVVLLVCVTTLFILEKRRTQGEMSEILSAFFSDKLLHDGQSRGAGREIQIVLLREPQNLRKRGPLQRSPFFDRQSSFSQSSRATRASFYLNNVFSTEIQVNLHFPGGIQSFFISRREIEENNGNNFETRFPKNFGYFVVSHVGLNLSKTEAILYVEHFCGGLCGGGSYFLLWKLNGVWRVMDEHVTWVS